MKDFNQIQSRNRIIKYLCLIMGVMIIIYTIYSLINQGYESDEEINESNTNIKKNVNNNFSANLNQAIFEGYDRSQNPYKITADNIIKKQEDEYILDNVEGSYITNKNNIFISSKKGVFDKNTKTLYLLNEVKILFDNLELITSGLHLDINNKSFYSKNPIFINYLNSSIQANEFYSKEQSNIIVFKGRVKSSIFIKP